MLGFKAFFGISKIRLLGALSVTYSCRILSQKEVTILALLCMSMTWPGRSFMCQVPLYPCSERSIISHGMQEKDQDGKPTCQWAVPEQAASNAQNEEDPSTWPQCGSGPHLDCVQDPPGWYGLEKGKMKTSCFDWILADHICSAQQTRCPLGNVTAAFRWKFCKAEDSTTCV